MTRKEKKYHTFFRVFYCAWIPQPPNRVINKKPSWNCSKGQETSLKFMNSVCPPIHSTFLTASLINYLTLKKIEICIIYQNDHFLSFLMSSQIHCMVDFILNTVDFTMAMHSYPPVGQRVIDNYDLSIRPLSWFSC